MNEVVGQEERWDLKKIIALLLFVGILAFGLKTFVLDKKLQLNSNSETPTAVQGVSTQNNPNPSPMSIQKSFDTSLNNLKKEVNNINVAEIASSSPQVQKVLSDLKNLQNLPQSQAKDACLKICNGL